jgi:hypothetical protein
MTLAHSRKDLVVLVADKQMEFAVKGLLGRPEALKIREPRFDIYPHPWHDSGCRFSSASFLQSFVNQYDYAMVVHDKKGCGEEQRQRTDIEKDIESELTASGWKGRAAAVVIDAELENWVWSDSPHVDSVLGWQDKQPTLRSWLQTKGYLNLGAGKPSSPKTAMKEALRVVQKAQSAALFLELAQKVSFERCSDPAFIKFKTILSTWFSQQ